MNRRNTIQRTLVLNAVRDMRRHVTADEVYGRICEAHPGVGKGTVYRNLKILADEGEILHIPIPDGADRFDFTLGKHHHIRCIRCGNVADVDMTMPDINALITNRHGYHFLDYDIIFKGICPECQNIEGGNDNG